jgi:signal transduction histidine kinase
VDDLLDLSKIEAGQLLIDVDIIKIREFFYQLANDAKIISAEKWENLNFEFKVTDNCPDEIYTDKIRLQQVLYNLLSNAIKFTEKGTIKVICDKQDDEKFISYEFSKFSEPGWRDNGKPLGK